jgi:hypothetical protein
MGEQQADNNGESQGWRHQPSTSAAPPDAGSYYNQTIGEPFSWAVVGDVMLLVVVRLHANKELCMELLEAMHANHGDANLRAQFDQAAHDIVVTMAELQTLQAQWDFGARSPVPRAPPAP